MGVNWQKSSEEGKIERKREIKREGEIKEMRKEKKRKLRYFFFLVSLQRILKGVIGKGEQWNPPAKKERSLPTPSLKVCNSILSCTVLGMMLSDPISQIAK